MDQAQAHATIMVAMLDKLRESGVMNDAVDTSAQPV